MDGLETAGPARPPGAPVPAPAPGSPGDQAIHWTATVEIPDPVVVDAEAARAWCGDLTRGESSLGVGPSRPNNERVLGPAHPSLPPTHRPAGPTRPASRLSPTPAPTVSASPSPAHPCSPAPFTCLAAEKMTLWTGGVPCALRVALAVGGPEKGSILTPAPLFLPPPSQPSLPHTEHRDVHVDVGHGALLQLAEELLRGGGRQPGTARPGTPLIAYPGGSLTSVNSVEPMSPNSSAPQLANTIDLRGRQMPGEGVKG